MSENPTPKVGVPQGLRKLRLGAHGGREIELDGGWRASLALLGERAGASGLGVAGQWGGGWGGGLCATSRSSCRCLPPGPPEIQHEEPVCVGSVDGGHRLRHPFFLPALWQPCCGLRGGWAASGPPSQMHDFSGVCPTPTPPAQKLAASLSRWFPGRPGKGMTCLDVFALSLQPTSVLINLMYSLNNRFREASWRC